MRKLILPLIAAACLAVPASAQTLDRIKQTGKLNFGYRTDAAPLSFQKPNGDPAGYTPLICVHIGQAIANALKMENLDATFVPVQANDRFDRVASGEIDLLCGAATITLSRRQIVDFSDPVYVDGTAVLLHKGAPSDFANLSGKKIGVREATTTQEALNNSLQASGVTAEVVAFASHDDGFKAMESKEIDAYFADQSLLIARLMASENAEAFQLSNEILTIEKQGLAMARGDADFRLLVDAALSDLYASGKIEEIFSAALPGISPGAALQAMFLISPTVR